MLKFFSKPKPDTSLFSELQVDLHSHLIPGIDDGSPDVETSLELIKGMAALGFRKIITTPHIMSDIYRNSREGILQKFDELQNAMANEKIEIEIKAAAEYFLDDHVAGLLKNKEKLLTISGNLVLVEFSLASPPMDLKEILFELQMHGYQPVIAHPERYIYLEFNKEFFIALKDAGFFFQANILSFGNFYGRSVTELANYLAKKNFYDFIGTDLHNYRHLEALQAGSFITPVKRLLDSGKIRNSQL